MPLQGEQVKRRLGVFPESLLKIQEKYTKKVNFKATFIRTQFYKTRGKQMSHSTKLRGILTALLVQSLVLVQINSCSSDSAIQEILSLTVQAPVYLSYQSLSPTEITFSFSKEVRVTSINFAPEVEVESIKEGNEVIVTLAQPLEPGRRIIADILVEDSGRNTLNVIVPFRARNDRMPRLVFNEMRTEFQRPRVEFVEFFALTAGNLGAMRLFIAGHSLTEAVYTFPPAEVQAGEYIVLHLRTIAEDSVDETGTDLSLSGGNEALDTARDFWVPGSRKLLHRTSALWLIDQDDRIIDAVLLSETPAAWGSNNTIAAAEFLSGKGAWLPADVGDAEAGRVANARDAISSFGTTPTRTISRDQTVPHDRRAGNWYIVATGNATPGRENSQRRHTF